MSNLISLQDLNEERRKNHAFGVRPRGNGIECPLCHGELIDTCPNVTLCSFPPQKDVHCGECGWKGYRVE